MKIGKWENMKCGSGKELQLFMDSFQFSFSCVFALYQISHLGFIFLFKKRKRRRILARIFGNKNHYLFKNTSYFKENNKKTNFMFGKNILLQFIRKNLGYEIGMKWPHININDSSQFWAFWLKKEILFIDFKGPLEIYYLLLQLKSQTIKLYTLC